MELAKLAKDTGIEITDKELQAVPLRPHAFHGEWNYTVLPDRTTAV